MRLFSPHLKAAGAGFLLCVIAPFGPATMMALAVSSGPRIGQADHIAYVGKMVRPAERGFSGKLVLVLLQDKAHPATRGGRSLWALQRPLVYRTHGGDTITAPAGMVTDLASIPTAVSWLLPPDGPWAQAAVIHDLLYVTSGSCDWKGHAGRTRTAPYTRAEADGILRDAMGDLGLSGWRVEAIWLGVRLGGGWAGWGR